MAGIHQFRTSMRGFNREDVVHYIEYLNNHYTKQIQQISTQLEEALAKQPNESDLQGKLDAALSRCAQLEAELESLRNAAPAAPSTTEEELAAYRRAERAERQAKERAQQIYTQANAVLADVTLRTDAASSQVAAAADQFNASLEEAKETFRQAVSALYAISPEE